MTDIHETCDRLEEAVHLAAEEWRPIPGHDHYEASSLGRIRSVDRTIEAGGPQPHLRQARGRVLRQSTTGAGHLKCDLGRATTRRVHRLVALAFLGPCPDGHEVCHVDGDPTNNRRENLRWGTKSENARDAVRHGTQWQVAKTHCPRRHELVAPNLMSTPQGRTSRRSCLACNRAQSARRRRPDLDLQVESDRHYRQIMAVRYEQLCRLTRPTTAAEADELERLTR